MVLKTNYHLLWEEFIIITYKTPTQKPIWTLTNSNDYQNEAPKNQNEEYFFRALMSPQTIFWEIFKIFEVSYLWIAMKKNLGSLNNIDEKKNFQNLKLRRF